ncbi:MAG: peptide chain release factor 2, partial [Campylobacterales bacterium]
MDNYEYGELLKTLEQKIENIKSIIKPDEIQKRLDEIAEVEKNPDFWNEPDSVASIQKEKSKKSTILKKFQEARDELIN